MSTESATTASGRSVQDFVSLDPIEEATANAPRISDHELEVSGVLQDFSELSFDPSGNLRTRKISHKLHHPI